MQWTELLDLKINAIYKKSLIHILIDGQKKLDLNTIVE